MKTTKEFECEKKRQLGLKSEVISIGPPWLLFREDDISELIDTLQAENARMREALETIRTMRHQDCRYPKKDWKDVARDCLASLGEKKHET